MTDRFQPPTHSDSIADCQGCDRRLPHTALSDEGFCNECTAEEEQDEP